MLDTAGNVLEKLIKPLLLQAIKDSRDLSDRQYGVQKGRSPVDIINIVAEGERVTGQGETISHTNMPIDYAGYQKHI